MESKVTQFTTMISLGQELPIMSTEMAGVMKGVAELFDYDLEFMPEILPEAPKTQTPGYGWQ